MPFRRRGCSSSGSAAWDRLQRSRWRKPGSERLGSSTRTGSSCRTSPASFSTTSVTSGGGRSTRPGRAHPGLRVETRAARFAASSAAWLSGFDVVLDGTDSAAAKLALNDAAVATGVPLVHAGASGFCAQLLTVLPGRSACLRCLFEDGSAADDEPACTAAGILGPVVALAGGLAAAEALRVLAGASPLFADRLLTIDARAGTWRSVSLARHPACAACGGTPAHTAAPRSAAR